MKRTIRTLAMMAVLLVPLTSCQKEQFLDNTKPAAQLVVCETVLYSVDGVQHTATIQGDKEMRIFINHLIALAEEGHVVVFRNAEASSSVVPTKRERVVFTTHSKTEANSWAMMMEANGYTVSIEYNQQTGIYTCIAVR